MGNVDAHQAEIILKLYELRRDSVMRASRDTINREFWPKSTDDLRAIMAMEHPHNAAYRQVTTYWDMVYSLAKYGAINPDFLAESNGEGIFLYAKVEPFVEEVRASGSPNIYRNTEWLVKNSTVAQERLALLRKRVGTTK